MNTQLVFRVCIFYIWLLLKKTIMGRAFEFRKARKMKRWSAMSKAFTRIGKDIVMAVKEGRTRSRFKF